MPLEDLSHLQVLVDTGLSFTTARDLPTVARVALDGGLKLAQATSAALFVTTGLGELRPAATPSGFHQGRPVFGAPPSHRQQDRPGQAGDRGKLLWSSDSANDLQVDWHLLPGLDAGATRCCVAVALRAGETEHTAGWLVLAHAEFWEAQRDPLGEALGTLAAQIAAALEQVQHQEQMKQRAERFHGALQAAGLGTWEWQANSGLIDFDGRAAELFGVPAGRPVVRDELRRFLVHPEDLPLAAESLQAVAGSGKPYITEYRIQLPTGGDRWIAVRGDVVHASDGQVRGMVGTAEDVSARKGQEDALRLSEKLAATGRLAATIAHEINNPLEAVTNLIYLAKTDPEAPPSVTKMLEIADGELARVSQIAQHTLGFYRDTTHPVTIDLNELLQAMVDLFERKLQGKRIRCELDLQPGLSIVALQGEIRQVISNLLVNAIDAYPGEGGPICIRARHRQRAGSKGVSVLISDQGSGIPHGVRHRLFTPFVTTKQKTGTGLGLWVTRGMVEKHGGTVRFRSRTETPSGTVFRVFLPQSCPTALFGAPAAATIQ